MEIRKLGVSKLKSLGFTNITYEDINPYDRRFKRVREKVSTLNEDLNERSKMIDSPSTTDAEAIEMIEVTSKYVDTTVNDAEQDNHLLNQARETTYCHLEN